MHLNHKLCLAPMLDWTDTHFRYFIRLLSPHSVLYTEMITTGALVHGHSQGFLKFNTEEHPLALQLGGSDARALAECTQMAYDYGYDEVNLNVGCPSDRVQSGRFGACLMKDPNLVAECIASMKAKISSKAKEKALRISVKCRLGVDEQEEFCLLEDFIRKLQQAGCDHVIVHARKAWLKGLSPKENRTIPPLNYEWVYELKRVFPNLPIIINGGIKTVDDSLLHLTQVDGVMIGRSACENPYLFAELESALFASPLIHRLDVLDSYFSYMEKCLSQGIRFSSLIRPLFGLFNGLAGAKKWRRDLSLHSSSKHINIELIRSAAMNQ